ILHRRRLCCGFPAAAARAIIGIFDFACHGASLGWLALLRESQVAAACRSAWICPASINVVPLILDLHNSTSFETYLLVTFANVGLHLANCLTITSAMSHDNELSSECGSHCRAHFLVCHRRRLTRVRPPPSPEPAAPQA